VTTVSGQGRADEALAMSQENARRFPNDALAHYSLANSYLRRLRYEEALAAWDRALELYPMAGALLYKAILHVTARDDLAGARAALERVTPEDRVEDRAVGVAMWLGLLERQPARVHEAAALTARGYFEDAVVAGAKAWSEAWAFQLERKDSLARQQWQTAEAVLRQRLRDEPNETTDRARLATTLAWLGRTDEAAREIAAFEATAREQPSALSAYLLAQYYAAQGDATKAAPYLTQAMLRHLFVNGPALRLDPQWDKLRGQPEFEAVLAGAKKTAGATP
jgi:tetratricopeptide (TPR) repeat protein